MSRSFLFFSLAAVVLAGQASRQQTPPSPAPVPVPQATPGPDDRTTTPAEAPATEGEMLAVPTLDAASAQAPAGPAEGVPAQPPPAQPAATPAEGAPVQPPPAEADAKTEEDASSQAAPADSPVTPDEGAPGHEQQFAGITFAWCPPGTVQLGGLVPVAEVAQMIKARPEWLADEPAPYEAVFETGFWIGKTEVTRRQWYVVMNTTVWPEDAPLPQELDLPVTHVSSEDIAAFLEKLSESGEGTFRLPTEAEWEYAARAGTTASFYFAPTHKELDAYAWNWSNAVRAKEAHPHAVGKLKPNAWGLFDTSGNVWELCANPYFTPEQPGAQPEASPTVFLYAVRGGSFEDYAPFHRSSSRAAVPNAVPLPNVGFRIIRE